jgi:hypothetical protein
MRTNPPGAEIVAITIPFIVGKFDHVGIVLAVNFHSERLEVKAVWFLRVTLGFVNLADHSRVHFTISLIQKMGKGTRNTSVPFR